jgi:hypothetical protein
VIADTFLSVGGTISTGGFGVTTYNLDGVIGRPACG